MSDNVIREIEVEQIRYDAGKLIFSAQTEPNAKNCMAVASAWSDSLEMYHRLYANNTMSSGAVKLIADFNLFISNVNKLSLPKKQKKDLFAQITSSMFWVSEINDLTNGRSLALLGTSFASQLDSDDG